MLLIALLLLVYGFRVHRVDQRRAVAAIIFQLITSCNCLGTSGTRPHAHSQQQQPPQVFPLKNDRKKEKDIIEITMVASRLRGSASPHNTKAACIWVNAILS
jgi:hypothetical protein